MQSKITRRAVLAGVPAVAAAAAMPAIPALAVQDPHPEWWAVWQAWIAEDAGAVDHTSALKALDHIVALEDKILETEPLTTVGLAVQLRLLEFWAASYEINPETLGRIAASAERLAGGAA